MSTMVLLSSLREFLVHKGNIRLVRRYNGPSLKTSSMFPSPIEKVSTNSTSDREGCKSQKLMINLGLIRGSAAGTFHLMPFTVRTLRKLEWLIDTYMQALGAQRISATQLSSALLWKQTGRWDEIGSELFKVTDRTNRQFCLSPTHEEAVTSLVGESPVSYKTLPIKLYQIGRKFRDEMRPKNGLLRCREFDMKDLYTFDEDEIKGKETYNNICLAYAHMFDKLGLDYVQVSADTGLMGGRLSHEFHILSDIGEDDLIICKRCKRGLNTENKNDDQTYFKCDKEDCPNKSESVSGIEIAHAFLLGDKYSSKLKATFKNSVGEKRGLFMGCYGIGTTRLLAASVESLSSSDEIRWPNILAPHQICIVPQKEGYKSEVTDQKASDLQEKLCSYPHLSTEVVLDDRTNLSIGRRVSDARKLGYPYVVVLGKKILDERPQFELIDVYNNNTEYYTEDEVIDQLSKIETICV